MKFHATPRTRARGVVEAKTPPLTPFGKGVPAGGPLLGACGTPGQIGQGQGASSYPREGGGEAALRRATPWRVARLKAWAGARGFGAG
jgi:hypothetical protein